MKRLEVIVVTALSGSPLFAQPAVMHPGAEEVRFEVASVKPSRVDHVEPSLRSSPKRLQWTNVSLRELIKRAYDLPDYQINGPSWIADYRYDVAANIPPPRTPERLRLMLQDLLRERFGLRVHRQSQAVQGYRLTIAKGGSKLTPAKTSPKLTVPPKEGRGADTGPRAPRMLAPLGKDRAGFPILPEGVTEAVNFETGQTRWAVRASPINALLGLVHAETGLPTLDSTGLDGTYDMRLEWVTQKRPSISPDVLDRRPELAKIVEPGERDGESFAAALKRQLGLDLRAERIPSVVLVVDYAIKVPAAN
jgi:uncharacterized protein (TIGR03435 family)